jgi:hypothetical protein
MRLFLTFCLFLLLPACASTPTATLTAVPTAMTAPATAQATAVPPTVPVAVASETPQATQPTPVPEVLFFVVKPDGNKVGFTLADLQKLPLANINNVNKGPKLKDVLAAAGVTDFQKVYLAGNGGKIRLTPGQVDDNTILAFTDKGTVKLVTTYLNKQFWVQDVNRIEVQ